MHTLVFLAAGFGQRFGGGVKQIEPIGPNGEVLMDYAIYDALKAGFDRVVFIIRPDIEADFRAGVGARTEKKCDVAYAYQRLEDLPAGFAVPRGRKKPWGTAQALLACRGLLKGPFCVLNADDYYGAQAFRLIGDALKRNTPNDSKLHCCMAGYVLGNTLSPNGAVTRGICTVDEAGLLTGINETRGITQRDGGAWAGDRSIDLEASVSMNIWGLPPAFIDYLAEGFVPFLRGLAPDDISGEYLLPVAVEQMIRSGRGDVRLLPTEGKWFGMTYAEDRSAARAAIGKLIAAGVYPQKL